MGAHARAPAPAASQAEWLSTHPADTTRIADIRRWLPEAMKYYRPTAAVTDRLEYDATGLPARCRCCAPTARCASSTPAGC